MAPSHVGSSVDSEAEPDPVRCGSGLPYSKQRVAGIRKGAGGVCADPSRCNFLGRIARLQVQMWHAEGVLLCTKLANQLH